MEFQKPTPQVATYDHRELLAMAKDLLPAGATTLVGWDCETYAIANNVVPQKVCGTFYDLRNPGRQTPRGYIYDADGSTRHIKELLLDDGVHFAVHNASFDAVVESIHDQECFALITRAYKLGRIHCTKLRQGMLLVADTWNMGDMRGVIKCRSGNMSYLSLAGCVKMYFDEDISGSKQHDAWRLRYAELDGVDLVDWPVEAVDYAISDAHFATLVWLAQEVEARKLNDRIMKARNLQHVDVLSDATRQAFAEFVLHHMSSTHGITVNPASIGTATQAVIQEHHALLPIPSDFGIYKQVPKSDRGVGMVKAKLQAVFYRALSIIEATDDPEYYSDAEELSMDKISTAEGCRKKLLYSIGRCAVRRETIQTARSLTDVDMEELETLRAVIETTADAEKKWKEIATFLTAIERGSLNPDGRLRYQMNGLVATGRTSSKNPNLQNLPRDGAARSCIEPAPGHVFLISDYSAAEFRTLAQIIEDEDPENGSEIARQYRANRAFDPHLFAAARMWGLEKKEDMPFEKAQAIYKDDKHANYKELKKFRTLAKILNFGLAGGLSHVSFVSYARGFGVELSLDESKKLCDMWLQVWHEMVGYFDRRKALCQQDRMTGEYVIEADEARIYLFERDGRARYCNRFTVMCNTPFQGVAASGCKEALTLIFEECYFKRNSPLFGSFPVLMVHDEVVLESPYDGTPEGLQRLRAAAARFEELMIKGMEKYTPDVPAEAEVAISTRWTKEAKSAVDENGELLVWSPENAKPSDDTDDVQDPLMKLKSSYPRGYVRAVQELAKL